MIKNICQELDISEDVLALKPRDFSMGYSKYLSLAISLVVPAKVYVLDNPTALLDADCTALLIDYLTNLSKNPEMTIVVATTDEKLLLKAKRIINLENGRATEGAKPVRVLKQEKPKKQPARTTIRKEVFKLEPPKKVAKEPKKVEKVESAKEIEEKKPEKPAPIKNSIQDSMFDIVDDTTRNSSVSEKKTSGSLFDHINKKKTEEKTVSKTTKKVADKKETKPAKTTKKVEEESSEMLIKPVKSGSSRKR